jgi:hypothetical protein
LGSVDQILFFFLLLHFWQAGAWLAQSHMDPPLLMGMMWSVAVGGLTPQ